jgi:hypothetical protein
MTEPQDDEEKADFWYGLLSKHSASPHDFRKSTGLSIELNFVSARILEALHGTLSVDRVLRSGLEALWAAPEKVATLSEEVRQTRPGTQLLVGDLGPLFSLLVIQFYTALEAGIEDMLLVAIRFRPGVVIHLSHVGVGKLPPSVDRELTLAEAQVVLAKLKTWSKKVGESAGDSAPSGWLRQLDAVGLPLSIDENHRLAIREMVYVRNCFAHRAGRMNDECVNEMSVLQPKEGGTIQLTKPAMDAYVVACLAMANELVRVAQLPSPIHNS